MFLRNEQQSEWHTAAWAGEKAVRSDFTEVVTFELENGELPCERGDEADGGGTQQREQLQHKHRGASMYCK